MESIGSLQLQGPGRCAGTLRQDGAVDIAARDSLANERQHLGSLRDALLPALVSGKLRVRDAERIVSMSV